MPMLATDPKGKCFVHFPYQNFQEVLSPSHPFFLISSLSFMFSFSFSLLFLFFSSLLSVAPLSFLFPFFLFSFFHLSCFLLHFLFLSPPSFPEVSICFVCVPYSYFLFHSPLYPPLFLFPFRFIFLLLLSMASCIPRILYSFCYSYCSIWQRGSWGCGCFNLPFHVLCMTVYLGTNLMYICMWIFECRFISSFECSSSAKHTQTITNPP